MPKLIYTISHYLARPVLFFYLLPWLLVLITIGTIAQRDMGLYQAEKIYFSSWIYWLGPLPLPGMYVVLGLMTLSLIARLILKSPWSLRNSGTIITHMAALLLLLGGMLTAVSAEEGAMILAPGEQSSIIADYHQRELAIIKNGALHKSIESEALDAAGHVATDAPFTLRILDTCRNCRPKQHPLALSAGGVPRHGMASSMALTAAPLSTEDEENIYGLTVEIEGAPDGQNGVYITFEAIAAPPTIIIGGDSYQLIARKQQRQLPFSVRLDAFEKFSYPGSSMAREYESVVTVTDGELSWQTPIRMNEPLRHKGYTLYQSSFLRVDGQELSVLAVVKNSGRVFPYVASIVMCLGLLMHLLLRRQSRRA